MPSTAPLERVALPVRRMTLAIRTEKRMREVKAEMNWKMRRRCWTTLRLRGAVVVPVRVECCLILKFGKGDCLLIETEKNRLSMRVAGYGGQRNVRLYRSEVFTLIL